MEISRWWSEAKPPEPARIRDSASARRWNFRDPPPPPLPGRSPFHPRRVRWLTPPANFHRPFGTDACSPAEWEARCRTRSNLRRTRRTLGPDRSPCGDRAMPALQICDARSGRRVPRGKRPSTVVPTPTTDVTRTSPPAARMRSRMPVSPCPSARARRSKPVPSSTTTKRRSVSAPASSVSRTRTVTRVPPECRSAFCIASRQQK